MKMLPIPLSLSGPPLGLWSDVLWRYPPAPPSPLADLKSQLPPQLPPDPRLWCRDDVTVFLRFCEREFDLPKFELDLFQMNGKALCLLNRTDLGERCPGAGDILHNVLQMLMRESQMMHRHLPSSPVTPTSRYPLSPHSHPPTPNWATLAPPDSPFHNAQAHLHHFMQPNSVTLSPAPSIDSQASSPPQSSQQELHQQQQQHQHHQQQQQQQQQNLSNHHQNMFTTSSSSSSQNNATSSSSNQSDSEEDSYSEANGRPTSTTNGNGVVSSASAIVAANIQIKQQQMQQHHSSPPPTPILKDIKPSLSQQITNVMNSWSQNHNQQQQQQIKCEPGTGSGSVSAPSTPSYIPAKREFFPESPEPNTNGRLLWDFLQQLLNDPAQRYSNYIAWKCRDTGVFKIVDPAGLAKLWGIQKNHLSMNYDKMSRALRYYYRVNILRKVQGERHCYQFLRNPTELKNIKNISLLRQSVANSTNNVSSNTPTSSSGLSSVNNNNNSQNTQSGHIQNQQQQQQQQQSNGPHSPQLPSPHHLHHSQTNVTHQQQQQQQQSSTNGNQLVLPQSALPQITSTSSPGYGPPPTSPHILHAIHGAFFNLSTAAVAAAANQQLQQQQHQHQQQQQQLHQQHQPPHSPVLPPTPSEKLQFSSLKIESNSNDGHSDDIQPTDLSVSNSERRTAAYQNGGGSNNNGGNNNDCYPLIRNSDGLTTIKLIRYNENNSSVQQQQRQQPPQSSSPQSPGLHTTNRHSPDELMMVQHENDNSLPTTAHHQQHQHNNQQEESEDVNVDDSLMMPTDLSK